MSIGFQQGILTLPTGPFVSPQATAFLARTSGLSTTERNAYIAMINGMVSDGTWTLFDWFYIFATNNTTTALLNLISTSFTGITHGTVNFTADQGFTGDGSTFYIDSGWQPTNGPNWATNSASFGIYVLTNTTSSSSGIAMGEDAGTNFDLAIKPLTSLGVNGVFADINSPSQPGSALASDGNQKGSYVISRTSSSNFVIYKNQSSLGTVTNGSGAPSADNVFIFANNSGTPGSFYPFQMSAAFAGGGLTALQEAAVESRINGYMTALGINVY